MPQSPPEHVHEDAMTRGEPRRAIRVAHGATDCEAGVSRPRMVADDPPGMGFPGRDGTPPAMTPAVSVPGDNLLVAAKGGCYSFEIFKRVSDN